MTHSLPEWAAAVSLGLSLSAGTAVPFLLLADAERWAWPNLGHVGDRLLVETVRLRQDFHEDRRVIAGLLRSVADRLTPDDDSDEDELDVADEVSLADTGRPWRRYPTERVA